MSSSGRDALGTLLEERRAKTTERIKELQDKLTIAKGFCTDEVCVYATGSFARGEASAFSDLDLFIVGEGTPEKPALDPLNEILIKADLIDVIRELKIPDFSGGGEYLTHHTVSELVKSLGTPEDDASNTFTARLLLLLESSPLVGEEAYRKIINNVVSAYWRDYADHKNDFIPAFLANDVLRMWRTFCVNYEARTETDPPIRKAKRKLKNYKLKHSRLLTCYSGLLYLLAVFSSNKTVSPTDAIDMVKMTPTKRLEWLRAQRQTAAAHESINKLIDKYEEFLRCTDDSEEHLVERFMDKEQGKALLASAYEFGNIVFEVLEKIGGGNRFHRLIVV